MVKCLPEFVYFTVFLKNRNFISKIKKSKVTDYAALRNTIILKFLLITYIFSMSVRNTWSDGSYHGVCFSICIAIKV